MIRFFILTQVRSGSHYLAGCLNNHSRVKCHNEIFDLGYLHRHGKKPVDRVLREDYYNEDPSVDAVGAIVHHFQFKPGKGKRIPKIFPDVRVILLERRNLLARSVSWAVAGKHNSFGAWRKDNDVKPLQSVKLNVKHLIREMQICDHLMQCHRKTFPNGLVVQYEHLVETPDGALGPVFNYLGVSFERVFPSTLKQVRRSLREMVENYDEVITAIKGTRFNYLIKEFAL